MDVSTPSPLLGGLSPTAFMRTHWQRRPLWVRQAWPGVRPPLPRAALFALAANEDVESRLVVRDGRGWRVRHGALPRRALPPIAQPQWTLLVQGLDLHVLAARAMLERFRFVPEARLDDLMMSWASAGGGVGPHVDAYDVFLLQVAGRRRWRVAPPGDEAFVPDLPLKILRRFEPQHDWLLEPGDLLYLPPGWGHDGVAEGGECMTCSIGFRAPSGAEIARELLLRLADRVEDLPAAVLQRRYQDRGQLATDAPGALPPALAAFARRALAAALDPLAIDAALGEALSEPKPRVWFEPAEAPPPDTGVRLAAGTRLLYDGERAYINGESFRIAGRDAALVRELADRRALDAHALARFSAGGRAVLRGWCEAGWLTG